MDESSESSNSSRMVHCNAKRHANMRAAGFICYEDKQQLCSECAQEHTAREHVVLTASFVVNKCRGVLHSMQKRMDELLRANQSNIEYLNKRKQKMHETQVNFDAELEA